MNRERNEFDQIGIWIGSFRIGHGKRLALFEEELRQIFQDTRDHQAGVSEVEPLRHRTGEVESFRQHLFAGAMRQMEGNVVAKHAS